MEILLVKWMRALCFELFCLTSSLTAQSRPLGRVLGTRDPVCMFIDNVVIVVATVTFCIATELANSSMYARDAIVII